MHERWSTAVIVFHWLTAILIAGLVLVGFIMTDLAADSAERLLLARLHTVTGILLMLLVVVRLVVRRRSKHPTALPMKPLHQRGVELINGLMYVVTFGIGLSGALTGALSTWASYLQGQLSEVPELGHLVSRQAHEVLVFVLLGLIVLHVGGVVVYELRHGGVLKRMLPAADRDHSA